MNNRRSWVSIVLSLTFYICAMRSKEAAICLPIIILLFELYVCLLVKKEKIRIHIGNMILWTYMVAFLVKIFTLPAGFTMEGQYKQDFSVSTVFKVLLNYIRMYFAWDDGSFSYNIDKNYTKIGNIGILVCCAIILVVISNFVKKKNIKKNAGIVMAFLTSGLSLAPLLVLPNIQHLLYFYFPAIFLSILFGITLYDAIIYLFDYKYSPQVLALATLVLLLALNNIGGAKVIRENFLRWGREALSTVEDISKIEKLPEGTHVYLYGADTGANVFNYSPGYIINILYEDTTIITELSTEQTEYAVPYAVWDYADGHVVETERVIE